MGIIQWIKKVLKIDQIKQIEAPKTNGMLIEDEIWREELTYRTNDREIIEKITQESKRVQEIKALQDWVLYKKEAKQESMYKNISETFDENVLSNVDLEALVILHTATKEDDEVGDSNIRDFIEDRPNNIVELVDKMIESAKEKAKTDENKDKELLNLIDRDNKSINKLIKELEEKQFSELEPEQ